MTLSLPMYCSNQHSWGIPFSFFSSDPDLRGSFEVTAMEGGYFPRAQKACCMDPIDGIALRAGPGPCTMQKRWEKGFFKQPYFLSLKDLRGPNQHFELHLETYWYPVQFLRRCYVASVPSDPGQAGDWKPWLEVVDRDQITSMHQVREEGLSCDKKRKTANCINFNERPGTIWGTKPKPQQNFGDLDHSQRKRNGHQCMIAIEIGNSTFSAEAGAISWGTRAIVFAVAGQRAIDSIAPGRTRNWTDLSLENKNRTWLSVTNLDLGETDCNPDITELQPPSVTVQAMWPAVGGWCWKLSFSKSWEPQVPKCRFISL